MMLLEWELHLTLKGFIKPWQLKHFQCFVNIGELIAGQTLTLFCLFFETVLVEMTFRIGY